MATGDDSLPPWLDVKLMEAVLRQGHSDPNLVVINLSLNGSTGKGDNYGSKIIIVRVDIKLESEEEIQSRSYFLKSLGGAEMGQYLLESGMWDREKIFFLDILPSLNDFLSTFRPKQIPFHPEGFYFKNATDKLKDLIVLKDMRPDGFQMSDRMLGLDLDQSLILMEYLGQFHAISAILSEKLQNTFNQVKEHLYFKESISKLFGILIRSLALEFDYWPELKHLAVAVEKIAKNLAEIGRNTFQHKPGDFLVLNHGDLWTPNILFKNYESGKVERLLFVDFQLIFYGSPAWDLQNVIYSCMQDEARDKYTNVLIEKYHCVLTDTLIQLNYSKKIPSMEYIKNEIKEKSILGFILTCSDFAISRADPSDAVSFEEMQDSNYKIKREKIFSKESTAKEIRKRLREFEVQGLFNFK